ncbi:ArnT family glycosyltransferase [Microbacterium pumilum]|uniref:Glycosyltransferase RgtA/B/C/D-like domain-containing protein n=1 Tax=Microbacterium pumilum TaxID=344165 RepID=A0ABN2SIG7_9MICO
MMVIEREIGQPQTRREAHAEAALTRAPGRLRTWLSVTDNTTMLIVFAVALVIGAWNVNGAPTYQDDEGTYVAQAVAVQAGGLAPYTYWYDHPPFGWIQLAILGWIPQALGLGAGSDLAAMRYVSAFLFAITATLVFLVARRMLVRRPFAVLAAAIFVCSPLSLTLGRQVFLDTVGVPWILFAFYLAISPRVAMWHHVGAGISFAIGVLSKLTLAAFGPALLLAMLDRTRWRSRAFSIVGFLGVGGLVIMLFPLMAALRGELISGAGHVSLQDGLAYQFLSRSGSGWIWEVGSPRNDLLQSWLFLDGYLIIGGLIGAALCAFTRRTRWIPVAILCFALPVFVGQGYLPAMYIVSGLPFFALAIGSGIHLVWRMLRTVLRTYLPRLSIGGSVLVAAVIGTAVLFIPVEQWLTRGFPLLASTDENKDWRSTLEWVSDNVPRDEVIVVPYSMWQDVSKQGWDDPWQAIVLEKVDLDSQFDQEHPGGVDEIDWIVEGPTVSPNIDYLDLDMMRTALESSHVVAEFGAWKIREVDHASVPNPSTDEEG